MAFSATAAAMERGTPAQLIKGFMRWSKAARAQAPRAARTADQDDAAAALSPEAVEAEVSARAFKHWKNADTGRWNPPKFSLRRQEALARAAYATGQLDELPESAKKTKLLARLKAQDGHEALDGLARPLGLPRLPADRDAVEAERIARTADNTGPYAGRSSRRMFKGSKDERNAPARRAQIQDKLARMPEIVNEWREVRYGSLRMLTAGKGVVAPQGETNQPGVMIV